jgi:hypothetical protein
MCGSGVELPQFDAMLLFRISNPPHPRVQREACNSGIGGHQEKALSTGSPRKGSTMAFQALLVAHAASVQRHRDSHAGYGCADAMGDWYCSQTCMPCGKVSTRKTNVGIPGVVGVGDRIATSSAGPASVDGTNQNTILCWNMYASRWPRLHWLLPDLCSAKAIEGKVKTMWLLCFLHGSGYDARVKNLRMVCVKEKGVRLHVSHMS